MEKPRRSSKAMNIINLFPTSGDKSFIKRSRYNMQTTSFSGPLVSIVPVEARRRNRSGSRRGFETPKEPSSPKVSCIGQIQLRKKNSLRSKSQRKGTAATSSSSLDKQLLAKKHAKHANTFSIRKIFQRKVKPGSSSSDDKATFEVKEEAMPTLGGMKRFVSRRESLGDFDWTKVQVDDRKTSEWFSDEDDDGEIIVPHSAPLMVGGGVVAPEPKKEVNLWRRRTMLPPGSLHLN